MFSSGAASLCSPSYFIFTLYFNFQSFIVLCLLFPKGSYCCRCSFSCLALDHKRSSSGSIMSSWKPGAKCECCALCWVQISLLSNLGYYPCTKLGPEPEFSLASWIEQPISGKYFSGLFLNRCK